MAWLGGLLRFLHGWLVVSVVYWIEDCILEPTQEWVKAVIREGFNATARLVNGVSAWVLSITAPSYYERCAAATALAQRHSYPPHEAALPQLAEEGAAGAAHSGRPTLNAGRRRAPRPARSQRTAWDDERQKVQWLRENAVSTLNGVVATCGPEGARLRHGEPRPARGGREPQSRQPGVGTAPCAGNKAAAGTRVMSCVPPSS
jgi:hypothetical protein